MRTIAFIAASALFGGLHAQQINNVTHSPGNPTTCDQVILTCMGSLPTSGNLDNQLPTVTGNHIDLVLNASGGTTGGSAPFSQPLTPLGPFAAGLVTITFTLNYNGSEADTWTGQFNVTQGNENPDAGDFGSLDVCTSASPFPLISVLGGTPDPGGVWLDPGGNPIPSGQFVPGTSPAGIYAYVFDQIEPCQDAAQQAQLGYLPNSDPGTSATVQICATGDPVDLMTQLGGTPQPGGTWTKPNGSPLANGIFTPGTDVGGAYTYTLPGEGDCGDTHATVTVQLIQPPNAGTDASVTLCFDDDSEVLNNYVTGEQTTGTWFSPSGFTMGAYNAAINVQGSGAGTYIYVVTGAVCPSDTAHVLVTLDGPPCTIGIAEITGNVSRFDLMPNPAQDHVTISIELAHAADGHVLELLDVDGRVLRSETIAFNGVSVVRTLDLSGVRAGAYIVRLTSPEGRAVRRLMVH